MDSGAKSLKGVMGPVNVNNLQSQRHILPFLEFSGLKDSDHNVKKAGFRMGDMVREEMEAILQRRCILLQVVIMGPGALRRHSPVTCPELLITLQLIKIYKPRY